MAEERDQPKKKNGKEEFAMSPPGSASRTKLEGENQEKDLKVKAVRNPYRWLTGKIKERLHGIQDDTAEFLSQEKHIKQKTREFCQWVAEYGGETCNIEESTITSLFASGCETKAALSVPIHVVELSNVPPELSMCSPAPLQQPATKTAPKTEICPRAWRLASGNYQPSWVKFKYGAWYLPANTWKKRDWGDPLVDPNEKKNKEMLESKRRSEALNQELSTKYATKAFIEFINKKGVRKPEFLEQVAEFKRLAELEEQKGQEAERLATQKSGPTKGTSKS